MDTVHVRILRYDPESGEAPHYEAFEVPGAPHMRVLDVLEYIQETLVQDVAFRWLCSVKRCGSCAVTVNGSPGCARPGAMESLVAMNSACGAS